MNKLIINSELSDFQAAYYVLQVIKQGKISKDNTQYCYVTRFTNGVTVYSDVTQKGTPTFRVMASKEEP